MRLRLLPLLLAATLLPAQAPAPKAAAKPVTKAAPKPVVKAAAKPSPEAETARRALRETLDAIDAAWFGQAYQGVSSVPLIIHCQRQV